jgi:AcrR family transcriptional regulator
MKIRDAKKEMAIEKMADYLLENGLEAATLRPLAEAAGTSDRMLLYYFVDRDELLSATLERIAARLAAKLDAIVPLAERRPFGPLLLEVRTALQSEELKPYMDIWLNVSARACTNPLPYRRIAGTILDGFLAWAADRIDGTSPVACRQEAALFVTALNGMHVLQSIGQTGVADVAMAKLACTDGYASAK